MRRFLPIRGHTGSSPESLLKAQRLSKTRMASSSSTDATYRLKPCLKGNSYLLRRAINFLPPCGSTWQTHSNTVRDSCFGATLEKQLKGSRVCLYLHCSLR